MEYLYIIATLAFSNFLYQILIDKDDWKIASERTFFQAIAILLAYLTHD